MSEKSLEKLDKAEKGIVRSPISELSFSGLSGRFPVTSTSSATGGTEGLLTFVFSFAKRGVKNAFKFTVKDWIVPGIIILIWVVTAILKSLNIDSSILKSFAFFTSSYNGLVAGALSISGGIVAKSFVLATFAGTLIPLLGSLFTGKARTEFAGFSRFFHQISKTNIKSLSHLAMILIGVGAAFALYGFLSVDGSFQNNFISILAVLSLIKNFGSRNSFLSGFLTRALRKTSFSGNGTCIMITGLVLGYTLSVPVSLKLSTISGIGYIIGGAAVIAGVIMLIAGSSERKAGAKI